MKAGAAFSPTHSASFLPSDAMSSLNNKLSTAILGCALCSVIEVTGVTTRRDEGWVSGEESE
jgi:hypothetical protein